MDSESRPHRTTSSSSNSSTSELFVCFTSRLSSSSMKLSSKSILSPGRSREPSQISLSTSLSRRLRSNGSMKGGQASPMFPTGGKKRGCAFENPEPSSPKVTCIGQVRVKTKKQGKKMRSRSKRRGEASFRKTEQNVQVVANPDLSQQNNQSFQYQNHQNLQQECVRHRNQRWVHLPLTICEALRAFGAEFSCFLPCRSSCLSSERDKEEKAASTEGSRNGGGNGRDSSCGAVFARWKREQRGVGGGIFLKKLKSRRRVEMRGMWRKKKKKQELVICIPPKNALLLMRCRSDPVKMAALANRFWESPQNDQEEEDEKHGDNEDHKEQELEEEEERQSKIEPQIELQEEGIAEKEVTFEAGEEHQIPEAETKSVAESDENESIGNPEINGMLESNEEKQNEDEVEEDKEEAAQKVVVNANQQEETMVDIPSIEVREDPEKLENEEVQLNLLQNLEEQQQQGDKEDDSSEQRNGDVSSFSVVSVESELEDDETSKVEAFAENTEESTEEEEKETTGRPWEDEETATQDRSESNNPKLHENEVDPVESKELKISQPKPGRGSSALPDCLLLMMCEPKLSMEVSKETWVCSTDFIRWPPERPVIKKDGGDEPKKRVSIDSNPPPPPQLLQTPRSSCSFPAPAAPGAGMSMTTTIEQKLVGPNSYEPFVLPRCKSEPRRSSAKLAPEACFWKNRKLEPHCPATLGIGAAGVGF
ncbi:Chloroplast protein HCF243 [Quillaja saponaria]|uniref:Chloroplast protein HCF243 n=1 Tax=Quillaja saponaria TaxID=32244 RepID=A0AAD7L186_QUISA|nr:Chloroplast protein HCF243 [Quillaja saponaria]